MQWDGTIPYYYGVHSEAYSGMVVPYHHLTGISTFSQWYGGTKRAFCRLKLGQCWLFIRKFLHSARPGTYVMQSIASSVIVPMEMMLHRRPVPEMRVALCTLHYNEYLSRNSNTCNVYVTYSETPLFWFM